VIRHEGGRTTNWSQRARPVQRAYLRARRRLGADGEALILLILASVVLGALNVMVPMWVPPASQLLVIFAGGLLLSLRSLILLYGAVAAVCAGISLARSAPLSPGLALLLGAAAIGVLAIARFRARLGVQGFRGDSMLVDLRDRLEAQGELPDVGPGWHLEKVLRSAGASKFSGDFLVASRSSDGRYLELALVDVSGKGVGAGTRALLLSGAFGGLLGSVPGKEFLPTANTYLLRQGWDEGFATAAHLVLDLVTGEYELFSAGHPPGAHFVASSGRWHTTTAEGPLLGVIPDADYLSAKGRLEQGDALLLYTDGLLESPVRDFEVGIDRLLGQAEVLMTRGWRHGARKLVDTTGVARSDDRALVLIWRS
jgi:stage II sporulation SpoE-like protein